MFRIWAASALLDLVQASLDRGTVDTYEVGRVAIISILSAIGDDIIKLFLHENDEIVKLSQDACRTDICWADLLMKIDTHRQYPRTGIPSNPIIFNYPFIMVTIYLRSNARSWYYHRIRILLYAR